MCQRTAKSKPLIWSKMAQRLYARIAGRSECNDLSFDRPLGATTPATMHSLKATRDTSRLCRGSLP